MHDALKVVKETNHLNIYIEQPCLTYEENLIVRDKCSKSFILDENIDSISALRAYKDKAMDIINIKISKLAELQKVNY